MSEKLNIALFAGGNSSEREVSLQSAAQVAESLDKQKYNVILIDLKGRDWHFKDSNGVNYQVDKNDFSITIGETKTLFDYALILIHGTPGEDGRLQGYLDMMSVPYSSCGVVSSVITFDKITCKRTIAGTGSGIVMAKDIVFNRGERIDPQSVVAKLGLPVFVKPNASGSSFGVTKVKSVEEILPAIDEALTESDTVLIEEFIDGREMGCGVMLTKDREYILPITEIVSKKEFFDYQAKYTAGFSDEITPADIDPIIARELNRMSRAAYKACDCRGLVRIDFIIRKKDSTPYLIEVNSIPGMSGGSIVPKQIKELGMTIGQMFDIVITDTLK